MCGQVYSTSVKISLSLLKCLKQNVENHKTNDKVVAITDQRRTIIRTFQKILI